MHPKATKISQFFRRFKTALKATTPAKIFAPIIGNAIIANIFIGYFSFRNEIERSGKRKVPYGKIAAFAAIIVSAAFQFIFQRHHIFLTSTAVGSIMGSLTADYPKTNIYRQVVHYYGKE